MKTKIIALGLGVAGCCAIILWARDPSPLPAPPQGRLEVAAVPGAASAPSGETAVETASDDEPRANEAADVRRGKKFRRKIQAVIVSANPADEQLMMADLAAWVRVDPTGAGQFARALPAGRWRETIVRQVAQLWTGQDVVGAENWAADAPDEDARNSAVADVCFQVAQADAAQAVEIAERHGLASAPGAVLANLVQQWAGQDLSGAAGWVQQLPAGEQRSQMLERLAYVQAKTEPTAAARLVVEQIPAGPIQDEATMTVVHQWAMRDLDAAAAWIRQFPPGSLRERAERELQGIASLPGASYIPTISYPPST